MPCARAHGRRRARAAVLSLRIGRLTRTRMTPDVDMDPVRADTDLDRSRVHLPQMRARERRRVLLAFHELAGLTARPRRGVGFVKSRTPGSRGVVGRLGQTIPRSARALVFATFARGFHFVDLLGFSPRGVGKPQRLYYGTEHAVGVAIILVRTRAAHADGSDYRDREKSALRSRARTVERSRALTGSIRAPPTAAAALADAAAPRAGDVAGSTSGAPSAKPAIMPMRSGIDF